MGNFGVIILAAGSASRMGTAKQLLNYQGRPLIRHAAETVLASQCRPVVVVLGANATSIRPALDGLAVTIVENSRFEEGMGTSIQAGLTGLPENTGDGAILVLADQPLVTASILDHLVALHRSSGKPIVAARYAGTVGVPVLFHRDYFPHLEALQPGQGCKGVILGHSESALTVDCPEGACDIDTPEDYAALSALGVSSGTPPV